jgi:hypothetical protein
MQLLELYVDFCFIFPMFMSEYSVRKGLLLVAEMATSSQEIRDQANHAIKGENKVGCTWPITLNFGGFVK